MSLKFDQALIYLVIMAKDCWPAANFKYSGYPNPHADLLLNEW